MEHNNLKILFPVTIKYSVLEKALQERFVGEIIKTTDEEGNESNYAQVLGLSLFKSAESEYDLSLDFTLQTLTKLFKNKELSATIHLALNLDKSAQVLHISDFHADATSGSWLIQKGFETILNNWMHEKLKEKMNLKFQDKLDEQMQEINKKLAKQIEATNGVYFTGNLDHMEIAELHFEDESLVIIMDIVGRTELEIKKIDMPAPE